MQGPSQNHSDIAALIEAAYEQYADAIFRHCYFRLPDPRAAEDLSQEVFIRTLRYLGQGNTIENMRAFLYKTANNLVVDFFRKPKGLSLESMQEKGVPFLQEDRISLQTRLEYKEITAFFETLEPPYRDVLLMRYVDELQPREIAEILGDNVDAVSVRIHRGLQKAREYFKEPETPQRNGT